MNPVIFLDTGPLGLVTNPKETTESRACFAWFETLLRQQRRIVIPETVLIAPMNVEHLSQFSPADLWQNIP
jgi:hypothetical protein